jgi:adenylosuccinate synthase
VCVAYSYRGERYDRFPPNQTVFNKCMPVYEELPGWCEDITEARSVDDLPRAARDFLGAVESMVGTSVSWASVGPGRDQVVHLQGTRA